MLPINFTEANKKLSPPGEVGDSSIDCRRLPVHHAVDEESGLPYSTSVWHMTEEEREEIAKGGMIKLTVWGTEHPMVGIEAIEEQEELC